LTKVFVEPIGATLTVGEEERLIDALLRGGVDVPSTCAGRGTCGKCLVRLGAGRLSEPSEVELRRLPADLRARGWRLACQAYPRGSRISIEVRETSGRRRILTTSRLHHGAALPAVSAVPLTLPAPTLEDARSDLERFSGALGGVEVPLRVLERLPEILRDGRWRAVAVLYGGRVVDAYPGDEAPTLFGAAVDIGTSKIVVYLLDLQRGTLVDQEAIENPQMRFGEDVISRLAQAFDPGPLGELADVVREGINTCLRRLYDRQGIDGRQVCDMTVVGNTAMHHLALGLSPRGLGAAPFVPVVAAPLDLQAVDFGMEMNPAGGVHFPPPIAGFVGSDALAVIAATRLAGKKRPAMAIDIGTNTEIALVHEGRVTVTSCASGPSFEGYQIQHGMKAVSGAVERVEISGDGAVAGLRTIAGAPPIGICGSGVVDLLAGLVRSGVIGPSGRFNDHPLVRRGPAGREFLLAAGANGDIVFTQSDVRALQLAKGAIHSGWELLLESFGVPVGALDRVYIAGAFGNYLDLGAAQFLGLFPPVPRRRVVFVGNAAGVGAQMALIDVRARRRMARLRERIEFLDLAGNVRFQEVFAGHLGFAAGE
jgi:uncharacterized 2Fe-2S/4Fe-4S cluster protein (DUF4445 family)